MRRTILVLAAAFVAGAFVAPPGALAQEPPSTTTTTTTSTSATSPPTTGVPPSTTTTSTTTPAPPLAPAAEAPPVAPKLRGVGDSVFHSAESEVAARLRPEFRPLFRSVLGATIAEMAAPARGMMVNAQPAVMVVGLGNPDLAEMDSGLDPYPAATRLLQSAADVPCVVWVNVKQRGVNTYYNRYWQQHATAFNQWLARAARQGAGTLYFANLHILDWNRATVGHPNWFLADGLHLNATGQANYARKIDRFVNRVCPP